MPWITSSGRGANRRALATDPHHGNALGALARGQPECVERTAVGDAPDAHGLVFRTGDEKAAVWVCCYGGDGAGMQTVLGQGRFCPGFGRDRVEQVVIGPEVVEGSAKPLRIYSDRAEEKGSTA